MKFKILSIKKRFWLVTDLLGDIHRWRTTVVRISDGKKYTVNVWAGPNDHDKSCFIHDLCDRIREALCTKNKWEDYMQELVGVEVEV